MKIFRLYLFFFIALVLLSQSCVAPSLSKAQSLFSATVVTDNLSQLGLEGVDFEQLYPIDKEVQLADRPDVNYNRVLELLNKALEKEDRLRKDKLLGTAVVLRSLTHFQLDNYEAASIDAERAQQLFEQSPELITEGGRDLALAYAIGPIIGNAQLFDSLEDWQLDEDEELPEALEASNIYSSIDLLIGTESSEAMMPIRIVDQLKLARSKVIDSKDTEIYLQNQILASLMNWKRILDVQNTMARVANIFQDQPSTFERWQERKNDVVDNLGLELVRLLDLAGEDDPSYLQWADIITP
ncbi:MAG: hypothetical protein AAFP08_07745 [Bacteroidota bacterium]